MEGFTGSTRLDEEQQEFYLRRFGERYRHVQQTPFTHDEHGAVVPRASRRERRRNRFKPKAER